MNTDRNLQNKLARPSPPKDLEKKIRDNWKQQLSQQLSPQNNNSRSIPWRSVAASIALFFLALFSFKLINETPSLITAAINDIAKDKIQNVGLSVQAGKWLATHQVNMPPSIMPIKMAKYCLIDGNKTLHLQIAGEKKGEVHLFILPGEFDTAFWQNSKGTTSSMPWQVIQATNNLSVLVLHTHDMNKEKVQQLIQSMFYA